MHVACHNAPGVYIEIFVLLAVSYACQYNVLVFISDEQVNPVGDGEGYKIQFVIVAEFVFAAHGIKVLRFFLQNYKTDYWRRYAAWLCVQAYLCQVKAFKV